MPDWQGQSADSIIRIAFGVQWGTPNMFLRNLDCMTSRGRICLYNQICEPDKSLDSTFAWKKKMIKGMCEPLFKKKNLRVTGSTIWVLSVVWVTWAFHDPVDWNTTPRYLKTFAYFISCPLICHLSLICILEKIRILAILKCIINFYFLQYTVRTRRALLSPTLEWDKRAVSFCI